jgi:Cys-tRNA(Pro)/Cys-tRNA(Cys) deacylase
MAQKLNSMRLLESQQIPYEVVEYDDSIHDAEVVAEVLGVPVWMVYKTLVVQLEGETKPILVMVAADRTLDLKKVALAAGAKKAHMAKHKDAEAMTGLKVGGIGALALTQKNWQVFLDSPATELQHILVNPGQRGINLRVPVTPLMRVTKARVAEVSRMKAAEDE